VAVYGLRSAQDELERSESIIYATDHAKLRVVAQFMNEIAKIDEDFAPKIQSCKLAGSLKVNKVARTLIHLNLLNLLKIAFCQ